MIPRFLKDGTEQLTNPAMTFTHDDGILTDGDMELSGVANFNSPFMFLDGVDDYIELDGVASDLVDANNIRGSIQIRCKIRDVSAQDGGLWGFGDTNANELLELDLDGSRLHISLTDSGTVQWRFRESAITLSDDDYVDLIITQDGSTDMPLLYINGAVGTMSDITTTDKTKWFADITGVDNGRIGCLNYNSLGNTQFSKPDVDMFRVFTRGLTATEALYYSRGFPVEIADRWASMTVLNTGSLTVGLRYRIIQRTGEDFTADGAADNNVGTEFIATGTNVTLDADDTVIRIGCITEFGFEEGVGIQILNKAKGGTRATPTGGGTWYQDNGLLKSTAQKSVGTQSLLLPQKRIQLEGDMSTTDKDHLFHLMAHLQSGADLHIGIEAYEVISGTADGNTPSHLIDLSNPFGNVILGDRVYNSTDDTYAQVTGVTAADLTLNNDAFPDGDENYEVFVDSRSGGYMGNFSLAGDDSANAWQRGFVVADPDSTDTRFYITVMKDLSDTAVKTYIDDLFMFNSLVVNGDFDADANWTKSGTNVTIVDGVAKLINVGGSTRLSQTVSGITASTMHELYFQIETLSGSPELRLEDINITKDSILEGGHNDEPMDAVGYYRIQFLSAASGASNRTKLLFRTTGGATVHLDNIAIRAVANLPDNFTYRKDGDLDGYMPQSRPDNSIFNVARPSHRFRKSVLAGDHFFEEAITLTASTRFRLEISARGDVGGETLKWGTRDFTDAGNEGAGIKSETMTISFQRFTIYIDVGLDTSGSFVYGATIADEIIYVDDVSVVTETVPALIFEKGRIFPKPNPIEINQAMGFSEDMKAKVADMGNNLELIDVMMQRLTKDQYDGTVNGLKTWFDNTNINWRKNTFTFQDETGAKITVRLLDENFDMPEVVSGFYSFKLRLMQEN